MIEDKKVIYLKNPSKEDALRVMREIIAGDDGSIVWTNHSLDQMHDRGISNTQVLNCLEKGTITEWPTFNASKGTWKFTMQHTTAGKDIGVAVALSMEDKVIIIIVLG